MVSIIVYNYVCEQKQRKDTPRRSPVKEHTTSQLVKPYLCNTTIRGVGRKYKSNNTTMFYTHCKDIAYNTHIHTQSSHNPS